MKRKSKKLKKPATTSSTLNINAKTNGTTIAIKHEQNEVVTAAGDSHLPPKEVPMTEFLHCIEIKKEKILEEIVSTDMANLTEKNPKYLFIELKLISIDSKCADYEKLQERFLCVDSNALIDQVKKFIVQKMNIAEEFFEIALMCNGFEVKSKCPLAFLKNRFFKDKELTILYYAIIEKNLIFSKNLTSIKNKNSSIDSKPSSQQST
jgi:hypothetical protein